MNEHNIDCSICNKPIPFEDYCVRGEEGFFNPDSSWTVIDQGDWIVICQPCMIELNKARKETK